MEKIFPKNKGDQWEPMNVCAEKFFWVLNQLIFRIFQRIHLNTKGTTRKSIKREWEQVRFHIDILVFDCCFFQIVDQSVYGFIDLVLHPFQFGGSKSWTDNRSNSSPLFVFQDKNALSSNLIDTTIKLEIINTLIMSKSDGRKKLRQLTLWLG